MSVTRVHHQRCPFSPFAWNLIAAQHSKVKGAHSESRDTVWYPLSSIEGYKANAIYTGQGREWRIPHNLVLPIPTQ